MDSIFVASLLPLVVWIAWFFGASPLHVTPPPMATVVPLMFLPVLTVVARKWWAATTLDRLLGERYPSPIASPIEAPLPVPRGGRFLCTDARFGLLGDEPFTLLVGNWVRRSVGGRGSFFSYLRVAGVLLSRKPSPELLQRLAGKDVLVAAPLGDGTVVIWSQLASGPSVRAHLERLARVLPQD